MTQGRTAGRLRAHIQKDTLMYTPMTKLKLAWGTVVFAMALAAFAQSPVITSFSQNGQLICSNLPAGGLASVEWASSLAGPWRRRGVLRVPTSVRPSTRTASAVRRKKRRNLGEV